LKKYKESIADYSKVISLDPANVDAYRNRGFAYSVTGENQKAATDFRAVLKMKPGYTDAQNRLKALESAPTPSPAAHA